MTLPAWANLDARLPRLLERFGPPLCSDEPQWDGDRWLHITAAARVWNPDRSHFLEVWSAKANRFQLPGAHGIGEFDLESVALREVQRLLGTNAALHSLGAAEVLVETIAEYWNTPAHEHLTVVFEFWLREADDLPIRANDSPRWADASPDRVNGSPG